MEEEFLRLRTALREYPDWLRDETDGLSLPQMAFSALEPPWARWSIDLQMRHIALVAPVWLALRAGERLREAGYTFPASAETIAALYGSGRRHLSPEAAPDREAVIEFMRPWAGFCCSLIDREGAEGLRALRFTYHADPTAHRPDDPKPTIEYHRIAARLHPSGFREDAKVPGLFRLEVGAILRHIHWNVLAHLRTIQRLKALLGLPPVLELPREGYLTLSEFYD